MAALTEMSREDEGNRIARRNAFVLAAAQALAGGNASVIFATGGIVGTTLAPTPALGTLPLSIYVIGMWMGTVPVGVVAKRYGRRAAFLAGAGFGVLTGVFGCIGVLIGSFALFSVGAFCGGLYAAAHQSYRFSAADTASEAFRPKAVAYVMAGGLFGAFVGPQLVILTKDFWPPYLFAASYLAQAGVALLASVVLLFVRFPAVQEGNFTAGRPLGEIARQPRFILAVVCGVTSFALMNLVMTSAPLAMVQCQHSVTDAALGIQWHIIAMYAPSFFTGILIVRFGLERVIGLGLFLIALSAVVGLTGETVVHFWTTLVLLGVGWNFGFVGATAMVTQCHRPSERNKVQSFNDFLVFGAMAVGSFLSAKLLSSFGWSAVNWTVLPFVVGAGLFLLWSFQVRPASLRRP